MLTARLHYETGSVPAASDNPLPLYLVCGRLSTGSLSQAQKHNITVRVLVSSFIKWNYVGGCSAALMSEKDRLKQHLYYLCFTVTFQVSDHNECMCNLLRAEQGPSSDRWEEVSPGDTKKVKRFCSSVLISWYCETPIFQIFPTGIKAHFSNSLVLWEKNKATQKSYTLLSSVAWWH